MSTLPPLLDGMAASMKAMAEHQRVISENTSPAVKRRATRRARCRRRTSRRWWPSTGKRQVTRTSPPHVSLSLPVTALIRSWGGGGIVLDSDTAKPSLTATTSRWKTSCFRLVRFRPITAMTNIYKTVVRPDTTGDRLLTNRLNWIEPNSTGIHQGDTRARNAAGRSRSTSRHPRI